MNPRGGMGQLARKLATVAAVAATGLACGWSALGAEGGVVMAIALGAGAVVSVFHGEHGSCLTRRRSR